MRSLSTSTVSAVVGAPDTVALAGRRRGLDPEERAFARRCRERGQGWQCIAHQLCMNVLTLREEMGDLPRAEAPSHARLRAYKQLRPETQLARALVVIASGVTGNRDVATAISAHQDRILQISTELINRGLLTETWQVTPEGAFEAARLGTL